MGYGSFWNLSFVTETAHKPLFSKNKKIFRFFHNNQYQHLSKFKLNIPIPQNLFSFFLWPCFLNSAFSYLLYKSSLQLFFFFFFTISINETFKTLAKFWAISDCHIWVNACQLLSSCNIGGTFEASPPYPAV